MWVVPCRTVETQEAELPGPSLQVTEGTFLVLAADEPRMVLVGAGRVPPRIDESSARPCFGHCSAQPANNVTIEPSALNVTHRTINWASRKASLAAPKSGYRDGVRVQGLSLQLSGKILLQLTSLYFQCLDTGNTYRNPQNHH